jgi:hypothetical protein
MVMLKKCERKEGLNKLLYLQWKGSAKDDHAKDGAMR